MTRPFSHLIFNRKVDYMSILGIWMWPQNGDTIICTEVSRLSRSTQQLCAIIASSATSICA